MGGLSTSIAHSMANMSDMANVANSMVGEQLGGGGCHKGGETHESLWQKTLLVTNTLHWCTFAITDAPVPHLHLCGSR